MPIQYSQRDPNAFYKGAEFEQQNRLTDLAMQNQAQDRQLAMEDRTTRNQRQKAADDQALTDRERKLAMEVYSPLAQEAIKSGNPRQFIGSLFSNPQMAGLLQRDGIIEPADLEDPEFDTHIQALASFGEQPKPQTQWQDEKGPRGSMLQRNPATGELRQVVGQEPAQPAALQRQFRTLSVQEAQAAGFPAGAVVQEDANTGALNVITKRDNTGSLSQKDMTTAKAKLNTISLARQQLANIKQRFGAIKNTSSAGAFGQGRMPSEKGRAFDAAVNQMRSTLTALTRVPGVGAMSDYETKLDQAKFPSRNEYESVTAQQIGDLEAMLNTIEGGYKDLLGGSQEPVQQGQQGVVDWGSLK